MKKTQLNVYTFWANENRKTYTKLERKKKEVKLCVKLSLSIANFVKQAIRAILINPFNQSIKWANFSFYWSRLFRCAMKFLSFCCGIIFLLVSCAELVNGSSTVNPQCGKFWSSNCVKYSNKRYLFKTVCGEANVVNHGRIVNGFESSRHKYPWMAALFSPSGFFMCGGSIISDKTILTAGHCMF